MKSNVLIQFQRTNSVLYKYTFYSVRRKKFEPNLHKFIKYLFINDNFLITDSYPVSYFQTSIICSSLFVQESFTPLLPRDICSRSSFGNFASLFFLDVARHPLPAAGFRDILVSTSSVTIYFLQIHLADKNLE